MARRIRSWWWDYVAIVGWLMVVFVVVGLPTLAGWLDLSEVWSDRTLSDVAITILTVVPTLAYFTLTESGPRRSTWGKRRGHLEVVTVAGDVGPSPARALVRNVVKLLPWQFGHLAASRFATAPEATTSAMVFFVASMALLAAVAIPPLTGRRGLHEVVSGTRVVGGETERRGGGQPASAPV